MIPILPFLTGKWGIRIGVGVAVLVALFLWGQAKKREGQEEGKRDAGAEWSQQLEQARAADRKATEQQIAQWQGLYEQAQARAAAAESTGRELARAVASIQQQRVQVVDTVNRMPDSALHSYIVDQLRLRAPGDTTACYTPSEERAIAKAIADAPLCQKQAETMQGQITALSEQVASLKDGQAALSSKYDALAGYATRLEGTYTALYNAWPRKARSWKCLGLWKCGAGPKIPTPDPQTLTQKEKP